MTENDALTAYRAAIAETNEARAAQAMYGHQEAAVARAEYWEILKGRAYMAARDAAVAGQVTCSDAGLGVADFIGDTHEH